MKEIKFNEINNQPKYKEGDIVGAYMFEEYALVSIEGVEIKRLSPYDLEKRKKQARVCCGITEVNVSLNEIKYITRLGGLYESGVVDVGLEDVQARVRRLEEDLEGLRDTLSRIRDLV